MTRERALAEAPESRTQLSRSTRETTGFEDREGHRAPFASLLSEGLCPSDSPARSLARGVGRSLRSRGSLVVLARITCGFAPRSPLAGHSLAASAARSVPVALARCTRSHHLRLCPSESN